MNTNPVTKQQVIAADNDLSLINPVIKTLGDINRSRIKADNFPLSEIRAFERLLKKLRDENLAIIDAGNKQYQNRPERLLIAVFDRIGKIPTLIDLEYSGLKHKKLSAEGKREELQKQGFSFSEIDKIVPELSQADVDDMNVRTTALKAEKEALVLFMHDAPQYRLELLNGTPFEQKSVEIVNGE